MNHNGLNYCDVCRGAIEPLTKQASFEVHREGGLTMDDLSSTRLCRFCTGAIEDYLHRLVDAQKELRPL